MWSLGDYTRLAQVLEPHAEVLVAACDVLAGTEVMDVAAGNGNFALAAARRGAVVTATDLTPHMVELGRARSAGVDNIKWAEADAEQLPFPDATYDVVASVFGAQFAPQPPLVASEMFRVAKRGGLVAMANYSPGGYLGRMATLIASFSAQPAFELPSPFLWGDEDELRRRFAEHASSIAVEHRMLYFESNSVVDFLEFWETTNAPQNAIKNMLPPEEYQRLLADEAAIVAEMNQCTDGHLKLGSPYILVLARKPPTW